MSQTLSIDCEVNRSFNAVDLLKHLENNGWTLNLNDKVTYLPLGDDGMYDWKVVHVADTKSVFNELNKKVLSNECVGFVLIDKETACGGEFLIWPGYTSFSLSLSIKNKEPLDAEYFVKRIKSSMDTKGLECIDIEIGEI